MKSATELLTAYLSQVRDPAAAALFADDGVIELPWVNARAEGPAAIEKFLAGLLAKVPDFRFQNIRIWIQTPDQAFGEYDVEALVPSTGKVARHAGRVASVHQGLISGRRRARERGRGVQFREHARLLGEALLVLTPLRH